jgi:hypothetical protein
MCRLTSAVLGQRQHGRWKEPPYYCLVDCSLCSCRLVSCRSACLASLLVSVHLALPLALDILQLTRKACHFRFNMATSKWILTRITPFHKVTPQKAVGRRRRYPRNKSMLGLAFRLPTTRHAPVIAVHRDPHHDDNKKNRSSTAELGLRTN